ncbi:hypothetical protein MSAN_01038000 [Mycena sanguinolenta]|uniref:Uncharacterized protein n=1 Tax=Mycena sanguinolenta TaxID=230812 RepID=A0A8H6YT18_9AGAR|nr:hypothetical protein MSAN_01038000 [Mycena sanguinolenta]
MWWPRTTLPWKKFHHSFLIFDLPEEKYGHHTALVWHGPKAAHCKVVLRFGRFEKEIADAELLGEIRMSRPYGMDSLEKDVNSNISQPVHLLGYKFQTEDHTGKELFDALKAYRKELRGGDVDAVAVYLVEVVTRRECLLFDGKKSSLPSGYLTYYTGKAS